MANRARASNLRPATSSKPSTRAKRSRSPSPPHRRQQQAAKRSKPCKPWQPQYVTVEDFLEIPPELKTEVARALTLRARRAPTENAPPRQAELEQVMRWSPVYSFPVDFDTTTVGKLADMFRNAVQCSRDIRLKAGRKALRDTDTTLAEAGITTNCRLYAF
jgi:hypothetical protein